jgi:hypothetical protein
MHAAVKEAASRVGRVELEADRFRGVRAFVCSDEQ